MAVERINPVVSPLEPLELLDALTTGVILLDENLCVLQANVAAQGLMAVGVNQARGRRLMDLMVDGQLFEDVLRRALVTGEVCQECELAVRTWASPREAQWVDATVTPLLSPAADQRLLLEWVDAAPRTRLTRDQELRARLEGSRMMTRQLAHEIKNPLGGMRGAAQLLSRELTDPSLREYTGIIIKEADRLTTLVDSMSNPAGPPRKALTNVHEPCEHVRSLLIAEAPRGVEIERDYDPSLPEGFFDRDQIVQALLNLARNALQAVGSRGRIVLRTRTQTHAHIGLVRHRLVARIEVVDDGPGVPDSIRSTLFYPLVTARPEGSGLGLAVSQELVTRNGGQIEFESEPGRTVFAILLPLEQPAMESGR
jgi:two-component system nitrogen regulation sensor histidine kinase GlnL